MPPFTGTDPKLWQVLEAIRTALASIVGDSGATYWYTPGGVYIVRTWADDPRLWNASIDGGVIYGILRTDRSITEAGGSGDATSGGNLRAEVEVRILISALLTAVEVGEHIERMMADVYRKLFFEGGATLGGMVDNIADPGAEDTNQLFEDGWAVGEITLHVAYTFPASAP